MKLKLIHDKFRKMKGGCARLLRITCFACGTYVLTYQKDGIGRLLRLYFDRILEPPMEHSKSPLVCPGCGKALGLPGMHQSGRMAYRLIPGSFVKKREPGGG